MLESADAAPETQAVSGGMEKYRLGPCIARGGMAEVCLGVQTGLAGFEKLVIIKRILPHLAGEGQFVQMLLDEARLAATLRHPGIVQITDLRRDSETFFLVMDYLRGESLARVVKRQRQGRLHVPVEVAAFIIASIADALHYAHTAKDISGRPLSIIHRDVSPSNIIVTYDGQPTLIDFGIAKAAAHVTYTQPGTIKGKFAYGSPEQVRSRPLDARSDVFSLGIVFHELLTGQTLFRKDAAISTIQAVSSEPILPPSQINPDVPRVFDDVVLCALERDLERRTPSAKAFRAGILAAMRESGMSFGREAMAAWFQQHLAEDRAKRQTLEDKALKHMRGGSISRSGDFPAPDLASGSGTGASQSRRRSTRPTEVLPSPARRRLKLVFVAVVALVVLALLFAVGRAVGHDDEPRSGAVEVEVR